MGKRSLFEGTGLVIVQDNAHLDDGVAKDSTALCGTVYSVEKRVVGSLRAKLNSPEKEFLGRERP